MVENVEKFEAEIEGEVLLDLGALQYSEIGVVESRPGKKRRSAVPKVPGTQLRANAPTLGSRPLLFAPGFVVSKIWRRRNEVASGAVGGWTIRIRFARIQDLHRTNPIRHIRGGTTPQSVVTVGLVQLHRKTSGEAGDSLKLPALCQALRRLAESPIERDGPNVTGHKIVA